MKSSKIICLICGLLTVSAAEADLKKQKNGAKSGIAPKSTELNRYRRQSGILQLESQFKSNGSLMSAERYALQARLDRVAEGIRNFNVGSSGVNKLTQQTSDQSVQYVHDDPAVYIDK